MISSCAKLNVKLNSEKNPSVNNFDFQVFLNPTNEFRSFPFYSINDSISEDEIKKQVYEFKEAGFGGFYLHSRHGLITEYLSDDWWKIIDAAVEAAQDSGLQAMFYDEDKWPSGYAGGLIPAKNIEFRSKCLARILKSTPLPLGSEIIKQDSSYNYIIYTSQMGYDIFNGTCYVDLFNPEMVREFINVSYIPYKEKYKTKITNYTISVFSDEPHVHARYFDKSTPNSGVLSYSPWLEKKFKELYAYSLRDKIELLFEEKENWREVRFQYYTAKALQFEESYTKQISNFCEKNGMNYTGHYLGEDVLQKVRDRIGNSMLHYRNMQQPGIDHLGLTINDRILTAKNLSSVANQYNKQKRLSELFGISGQNMNFEDRKWIAGWHSILGINHFCPHLTLYSMKGARKRDYPPTFSYQQPYWGYNKIFEDYSGRISYATSIGKYAPQILVINPLESEYIKSNNEGEFTSGINKVLEILQAEHYDYDIGDEQIIADTAIIIGNKLHVGAMSYRHIILPDMISIRKSTIDLILELHKNGGLIFSTGRFPKYVDGVENTALTNKLQNLALISNVEKFHELLFQKIKPNVIINGENCNKVWSQTRKTDSGKLIQFYNSSRTETIQFEFTADMPDGNIVLWNPSLAKCFNILPTTTSNIQIELAPSSNIWITSGELSKNAFTEGNYSIHAKSNLHIELKNKWQGYKLDPNAITLDFASYSTDYGKTFSNYEPVIGIFYRLSNKKYFGNLTLKYKVNILDLPNFCNLVLEQANIYKSIKINDQNFIFNTNGFYIDHTFKKSTISDLLKEGTNTIQLELDFKPIDADNVNQAKRYGTEIESIYLIGDFGVFPNNVNTTYNTQKNNTGYLPIRPIHQMSDFVIGSEKKEFDGNLTLEGYPFYAGSFVLQQKFNIENILPNENYFVELPNCESILSIVKINGKTADSLAWSPYKTEITDLLKKGENTIEITLINSLRNLLGPHHHKGCEIEKVGPNSFTGSGGFPDGKGEANWYDLRKEFKPTSIWTDTYNHIPFGFIDEVIITTN